MSEPPRTHHGLGGVPLASGLWTPFALPMRLSTSMSYAVHLSFDIFFFYFTSHTLSFFFLHTRHCDADTHTSGEWKKKKTRPGDDDDPLHARLYVYVRGPLSSFKDDVFLRTSLSSIR